MNRYDEEYNIRIANNQDVDRIMYFFLHNWNKNHILANDKKFFQYEFCRDNRVNFIIAEKKKEMTIEAVWGFYQYNNEKGKIDIAGGPWAVSKNKDNLPFLGVELLNRAHDILNFRARIGIGDNPNSSGIYHRRIEKSYVGKVNHFYIIGDYEEFKIAVINERYPNRYKTYDNISYEMIYDTDSLRKYVELKEYKESIPYKNLEYLEHRYLKHPCYKYSLFGVKKDNLPVMCIIAREVYAEGRKILRIVDCIGIRNCIRYCGELFNTLKKDYEYIDMYNYGIEIECAKEAGFTLKSEYSNNIIPNYFEPFLKQNVDIYYSSTCENFYVYKGDADQDRPNRMR